MVDFEPARAETIEAITNIVSAKLDNPEVVRVNPDQGHFIGEDPHTKIDVTRYETGSFIRFIESYPDTTSRSKPGVLVYDFDIDGGEMNLYCDAISDPEKHSPMGLARLEQLKSGATMLTPTREETPFLPSEPLAQAVLASVRAMKIFIE